MAQLYKLTYSKSKSGKKITLMIDILRKCENYKKARSVNVRGVYDIVPAESDDSIWRKKQPSGGYILKNGFNEHT